MIARDERLRRVSESIFEEAEPPEDRRRPLEWRGRLNHLDLPLRNLQIVTTCVVHDSEFDWEESEIRSFLDAVQTHISDVLETRGVINATRARDRVYVAEEVKDEDGIFVPQRVSGSTTVTLRAGTPVEEGKKLPAGLYRGYAFRMDYEPGEDNLHFELTAPKSQLRRLVDHFRHDSNATLEFSVYLLSFSYEVDDALREPYHPLGLVIVGAPPCLLFWIGVSSRIGDHRFEEEADDREDWVPTAEESAPVDEATDLRSYVHDAVATTQRTLKSIQVALWVLAVVLALSAVL